MATSPPTAALPATKGPANALKRWLGLRGATDIPADPGAGPTITSTGDAWDEWISDPVTTQFLAGSGSRPARNRQSIYTKWQDMLADPVITSALRLHVTAALGGHETKGAMVFIEATEAAKADKTQAKLVEGLAQDLQPLFDRLAPTVCFNAITFGDAFGRIYAEPRKGVRDVYADELVYPPLVQPYERANTTVGYTVSTGGKFRERLTVLQMARMKMPRMIYLPQDRVIEKAWRVTLRADRVEDLPAVPALAGGSFLDGAEVAYDKFSASWSGLVGQRVQDSINESMVSVAQTGMTPSQRKTFKASLVEMFERSNAYIQKVVASGQPVFGRIYHFLPTSGEKQVTEIRGATSAGRPSSLTIDDVMMHARFLAGALGMDLSMIGFADQMGGGLGEGGFFRVSAQAAERSRAIRAALTEFFDHIISVHLLMKHGIVVEEGQPNPWQVNYFSGISALETERAKTKAETMNSAALLVQTLMQLKDLGLSKEAAAQLLEQEMGMDAKTALMYATALEKAKSAADALAAGGEGGGGFGGGPVGPIPVDGEEAPPPGGEG